MTTATVVWGSAGGIILGVFGVLSLLTASIVTIAGTRKLTVATAQDQALSAASVEIEVLKAQVKRLQEQNSHQQDLLDSQAGRIETIERIATSRDLIIDVATHLGVPEEVLKPYQRRRASDQV